MQIVLPSDGLDKKLIEIKPDLIVHAAGTANVGASVTNPFADFQQSAMIWASLLDAVRKSAVNCRLIFLSSAAVYGSPSSLPIKEQGPLFPISPYGYHKKIAEELAYYYSQIYHLDVCSLRIFSAYGRGLLRQVIFDICQKAYKSMTVTLNGTGKESRDFIHATDIAFAVGKAYENAEFNGSVYNLASGVSTPIRLLAEKIVAIIGMERNIIFDGYQRDGDPLKWQADISKINSLGFTTQTTLEAGLIDYVCWYKEQRKLISVSK
jgi:UDP-glucose 4-epimerase